LTAPEEGLRKVLALERDKKFTDSAVVGGLDSYLLQFLQANQVNTAHPISKVVQQLPPGGYRALHKVQRERVVDALLEAVERHGIDGVRAPVLVQTEPAKPPPKPVKKATAVKSASATPLAVAGSLNSPVTVLQVGREAEKFRRLGANTVRDLLFHFPREYRNYSEARPIAKLRFGEAQTVVGTIWSVATKMISRYKRGTEAIVSDDSGTIRVIWWGQTWLARNLRQGQPVVLSGSVSEFRGRLQMENPELEQLDEEELRSRRLVPVYPSTEKLSQRTIRHAVRRALDGMAAQLEDALPEDVCRRNALMPVQEAIRQVHFPDSEESAVAARQRFAFEELLYIEIGVVRRRREWQAAGNAPVLGLGAEVLSGFVSSLPFRLTGDQEKAIDAILEDVGDRTPMTRLLQGEVGSGKTAVAAAALLAAVHSGYQGAIMAPTEILAEQHLRTLSALLDAGSAGKPVEGPWFEQGAPGFLAFQPPYMGRAVTIALLTGSLRASTKSAAQEAIADGTVDIAVGTHALMQEQVSFKKLGLAVIDEQHRFGVEQRAALREKGRSPHVLVMTATPIPRTLALTVYGDLDITTLREMPGNRPAVKTYKVLPYRREEAFDLARRRIEEGRQVFVICPLVEESESIAAKAAVQEYQRLQRDEFPGLRVGLVHGRMPAAEKEATMRAFRDHDLDVLVSTAVVEVGVDVPNATVMLIEGAERFGLSQLHQFRGRVRRSQHQGYCFLLSDTPTPESEERLALMETVSDGEELAEHDLNLRGPGEYFGTRQSGMPDLRVAKLNDMTLIETARNEATRIVDEDPDLGRPEHRGLRSSVEHLWGRVSSEVS
jgi:ATP-dependent DNA helicase RecG